MATISRSGIHSLNFKDKSVLYAAYMPFLTHGGIFIATENKYRMGEEIFMLLQILDEAEKIPVAGRVVWITPKGAQGNKTAGIGVQFNGEDDFARQKIEHYLAGMLEASRRTHTM